MEEQFPIDEELVRKFIEKNKKAWHENTDTDGTVLINLSMVRMQIPWIVPKLLFAKGLGDRQGVKPIAITWKKNSILSKFFCSYGVDHVSLDEIANRNLVACLRALFKTTWFMLIDGTGEGLKRLAINKISVGKNLYEDILRTSSMSTLKTCRNKTCLKKIFHLIWVSYALEAFCRKKKVKYAVTDDMAYHEGMFIKLFMKQGTKIYASTNVGLVEVSLDKTGEVKRYTSVARENIETLVSQLQEDSYRWTEQYLEERFKGNNGREIDRIAFVGKQVLSKEDFIKKYQLGNSKKNVVIMAHTFTDAVYNYGDYYFRDYYDWLEQTLKIASLNQKVNWILKPHPTRHAYNESEDSIEALFEKYKKENMYILSDDVSSESIKNIADVIVTIGGNAGAEYSCFGIPAIIIGKPYYSGWGYTIEPKTYEEYEKILLEVETINSLSSAQTKKAKEIFCLHNNSNLQSQLAYSDEFANLLNGKYKTMLNEIATDYFKSNDGTQKYNNEALITLMNYMDSHDLKQCEYYVKGNNAT